MTLRAYRTDGSVVELNDIIRDFRGDDWVFVRASRAREPGKSGKVIVRRNNFKREFYDNVFKFEVVEEEEEEAKE
jgi:hypothetical protein